MPSETPMVSGGLLIMDYANTTLIESFVMPYYKCAYTQKCISPKGSDIGNDRQDQSQQSVFEDSRHIQYSYHESLLQNKWYSLHKRVLSSNNEAIGWCMALYLLCLLRNIIGYALCKHVL